MLRANEPERNEPELKALFQTMRQADAGRAPGFAQTYRALPQQERLGYLRTLMGAMAVVAVVILAVIGVNAWRRTEVPGVASAPTKPVTVAVVPQATTLAPTRAKPARVHPPRGAQPAQAAPSISTWKSPTDALLKFPGDDLMSGVPKIGIAPASGKTVE